MKCCVCQEREAKVHLTTIVGDKMQKLDLCEECSKNKGLSDSTGFALADLLLGLGASQEVEQVAAASEGGELKCPHCGFTQADFKKSGRFGCPECYQTFSEALEGLLKPMHKGIRHVGKVPEALRQSQDFRERVKQLQKRLAKAIQEENFELAAQLRDELKQATARAPGVIAT
jgi:protein arginine kinase activator